MRTAFLAFTALAFLAAACGNGGGTTASGGNGGSGGTTGSGGSGGSCTAGPATGDLPCDVGGVMKAKCQSCHTSPPQNGAHFPLLTYEDTQQPLGSIQRWQRMAQVIEPDGVPHMPYKNAPQLTDAELGTMRTWLAACAPPAAEGMGCDSSAP